MKGSYAVSEIEMAANKWIRKWSLMWADVVENTVTAFKRSSQVCLHQMMSKRRKNGGTY